MSTEALFTKKFLEYIKRSDELTRVKTLTLESISLQLNTYKKYTHDFLCSVVETYLTDNGCKLLTWPADTNLQPDIYFMTSNSTTMISEVTLAIDKTIIQTKLDKYSELGIPIFLISPKKWVTPDLNFSLSQLSRNFKSVLQDHFARLDKLISYLKSCEVDFEDVDLFNEFFEFKELKDTIVWDVPSLQAEPEMTYLPNEANARILLSSLKSLMDDDDVKEKIDLERTQGVSFREISSRIEENISEKFQVSKKKKISFLFYPGNVLSTPVELNEADDHYEQSLLKHQMNYILDNFRNEEVPFSSLFVKTLNSLSDDLSETLFNYGVVLDEEEADLRTDYQKSEDFKKESFLQFQLNKKTSSKALDDSTNIVRRKTVNYPYSDMSKLDKEMMLQSHTSMTAEQYAESKMKKLGRINNAEVSCTSISLLQKQYKEFLVWKDSLEEITSRAYHSFSSSHFMYEIGPDSKFFSQLKGLHLSNFKSFMEVLTQTKCFQEAENIRKLQEQVLHFQGFNMSDKTFSLFNSGIPDVMYVLRHSTSNLGNDVGRSFCIIKIGLLTELDRHMYGFGDPIQGKTDDDVIYISRWRRISSERLTFHIDQFYSVISTTYNTAIRNFKHSDNLFEIEQGLDPQKYLSTYVLRHLIGQSHKQQFAVMLSDYRYLYMHSVSDFSSVGEFCLDKFTMPVTTFMEYFLVRSISQFDKLRLEFLNGGVLKERSEFIGTLRDPDRTGGFVNLPGILDKRRILNIQDFLDEMFIYVHTNKEPASLYHENVKAFQTIQKYQSAYEQLSSKEKLGDVLEFEDLKRVVLNPLGIGHCRLATMLGSSLLSDNLENLALSKKIERVISKATVLDINSTRAVIPELPRQEVSDFERFRESFNITTNAKKSQRIKKGSFEDKSTDQAVYAATNNNRRKLNSKNKFTVNKKRMILFNLVKAKRLPSAVALEPITQKATLVKDNLTDLIVMQSKNLRCKVHDSTLHLIKRHSLTKVTDLAFWNIKQNKGRILADVCIKAQYGAKREFYVINHGAKAMVKVLELMFETISKHVQEELISVPGDKKMYQIQTLVDRNSKLSSEKLNLTTYFCNGDCTKWSAAETMECFDSYLMGFSDEVLSSDQKNYCKLVLSIWKKKKIQIPSVLNKNLFFNNPDSDKKFNGQGEDNLFSSEQNFLQGMFNYLSSLKAVSCTMFTEHIWKLLYPEKTLYLSHMEHSDDYAFVCVCDSEDTFFLFKRLHRICMRLFGINDSQKKTNCQRFLLEFISLINFNGVMVYPEIKKVKEVGLNIGCLGYTSDIKNTISRVGEAGRMGVSMDSCYAMARIQNVRIARAYGLFTSNNDIYSDSFAESAASMPIELWGVPDMHPIFYIVLKGDCNNFRIKQYGTPAHQALIDILYLLQRYSSQTEATSESLEKEITLDLYHPGYTFSTDTKLLTKMKKVTGMSYEESVEYFEKHPLDVYKKPRSPDRFEDWLKAKYHQRGFGEAYMKQSKAKMQMRLSHFAKQNCLTGSFDETNLPTFLRSVSGLFSKGCTNIGAYMNEIYGLLVEGLTETVDKLMSTEDALFLRLIVQGYDIACERIYSEFSRVNVEIGSELEKQPRAYNMPSKPQLYHLSHDCSDILQYLISPEDFSKDKNSFKSASNAVEDIKKVDKLYGLLLNKYGKKKAIKFIMSLNTAQRTKSKPCILYKNPKKGFIDLVKNLIKYRSLNMNKMKLNFYQNPAFTTSTNVELEVTGKLALEVKAQSDIMQYLPLNDLGIWYTLVSFYNRFDLEDTIEEMSRFKIQDLTCKEYIERATNTYVDGGTMSMDLQKVLCVLALQLNNDTRAINHYLESNLSFAYKYYKDKQLNQTSVEFTYLGEKFLGVFNERDNNNKNSYNLMLYFDHSKLQLLPGAYLLLRRLSGLVSMNILLDRHTNVTIKDVPFCLEVETSGIQYYGSCVTNTLTLAPNPKMDKPLPFVQLRSIVWRTDNMTKLSLSRDFEYDFENLTLMSGSAKLFTLPFLHLKQLNLTKLEDDIYLIDLKLYISFFMQKSRGSDLIRDSYYSKPTDIIKKLVMKGGKLSMTRKAFLKKYATDEFDKFKELEDTEEKPTPAETVDVSDQAVKQANTAPFDLITSDPFGYIDFNSFSTHYNPDTEKELNEAERLVSLGQEVSINLDIPLMFESENIDEHEKDATSANLQSIHELGDFSLTKKIDVERRTPYTVSVLKSNLENALVKLVVQDFTKSGRLDNVLPSALFGSIVELLNPKYTRKYTPQMKLYINKLIEGYAQISRDFKKLRKFNHNTGMLIKRGKVLHVRFLDKALLSPSKMKELKEKDKYYIEEVSGGKSILCFPVYTEDLLIKYCRDVKEAIPFYTPSDIIKLQEECDKEAEKVDDTLSLV